MVPRIPVTAAMQQMRISNQLDLVPAPQNASSRVIWYHQWQVADTYSVKVGWSGQE